MDKWCDDISHIAQMFTSSFMCYVSIRQAWLIHTTSWWAAIAGDTRWLNGWMQLMKLRLQKTISSQHPRDALCHMVAGTTDSVETPALEHHGRDFLCRSRGWDVLSVSASITVVLCTLCNIFTVVTSDLQQTTPSTKRRCTNNAILKNTHKQAQNVIYKGLRNPKTQSCAQLNT